MQQHNKPKSFGQIIGLVAALIVLVCFFVPWLEVGLSFLRVTLSGWQLASGSGPAEMKVPGVMSLWLVPLSMVVTAIIIVGSLMNAHRTVASVRSTALLMLMLGGVSALALLYNYFDLNHQFNRDVMGMLAQNLVSYAPGWAVSLLGSLAVLAGGAIDLGSHGRA